MTTNDENLPPPPLPPPQGYDSWLEFAARNVPTRDLFNDALRGNQPQWPEGVTRDQMREAVEREWRERTDVK